MSEKVSPSEPIADRNLLFGVVALQADYIDSQQFVDGCMLWGSRKEQSLADVLMAQGWITQEDRVELETIVGRKVGKRPSSGSLANSGAGSRRPSTPPKGPGNDPFPQPEKVAGPLKPDNIELRRLHSTGGIGQVWLAHDRVLERDIALKELRVERKEDESAQERFFREAQITAQLTHPGVVPVHEYRDANGRSFYTMKFLQGRTLTEVAEEHHRERRSSKPFTICPSELLRHFLSICNAIAYAHDRKIIHRDLKGDNVIIGTYGEVTVIDWGLAKRLDHQGSRFGDTVLFDPSVVTSPANATMQGQPIGTPAYMSPEQARGDLDAIDTRTDVYGLAAILYEILTGVPPFQAKDVVQLLRAVDSEIPKPPSSLVPEVDPILDRICLDGLAKDPADRQQSAQEIRDQVQNWIADQAERKRTELERERFFSLSPDLLLIFDADANCRQVNPAVEKILGWTVEEFLSRPIYQTTHPEDWPRTEAAIAKVFSGTPVTEFEERDQCKDGTYKWIQWSASLIEGEGMIYAVGRDVTARRLLEGKFRGILESAPDSLIITDENGAIEMVNSNAELMFGYDRGELVGREIDCLVPERLRHDGQVFGCAVDDALEDAESQFFGLHRDGAEFPIDVRRRPVKTESGLLVCSAIRRSE